MSAFPLAVRGLKVQRGGREILSGVSLQLERGEIVMLMAPSGGGKTTVLRAIAGLSPFDAGDVSVGEVALPAGRLPVGATARALRRQVGMVFQQHFLFDHLTALENVALAPVHVLGTPRAEAMERAMRLLSSLGVEERAPAIRRPGGFSMWEAGRPVLTSRVRAREGFSGSVGA